MSILAHAPTVLQAAPRPLDPITHQVTGLLGGAGFARTGHDPEACLPLAGDLVRYVREHGDPRGGPGADVVERFLTGGDPQGRRRLRPQRVVLIDLWRLLLDQAVDAGGDPWRDAHARERLERFGPAYVAAGLDAGDLARLERLDFLRSIVGEHRLEDLDEAPLPPEPLDLTRVPADLHRRIGAIGELVDAFAAGHGGDELGTAAKRLLARSGARAPERFRRASKDANIAAALCWAVARGNDLLLTAPGGQSGCIARFFRVPAEGMSGRGRYLVEAAGVAMRRPGQAGTDSLVRVSPAILCDPSVQTASTRRLIAAAYRATERAAA